MSEQIQAIAAELNACRNEPSKFANPQRQPWGTTAESNALHPDDIQFHDSRKSEALKTLSCLSLDLGGWAPESEVEKAVALLMGATLVARTTDNLIEPKNDAISFFLNFVSMTIVHLGHIKPEK